MTQPSDPFDQPPQYPPPPPGGYPPPPPVGNVAEYGVNVPPGTHVDPGSGLILPDGVVLAGVGRRIGAYFLAIPLVIVTLVIGYLIWGLMLWRQGTTPALRVLGMKTWRPQDGRPAGFWWMALREIIGRLAEGILGIITGLISFILFVSGREHKALHDIIAGTVVVHDPERHLG